MTVSSDSTYELSRDNIIAAAMRKIGALSRGQSPDSEDLSNAQIALNSLIALFQTLGMPLWARAEYSITLVASQRDYTIGSGQTINTDFPLRIYKANLSNSDGSAVPEVNPMARADFMLLNTSTIGTPVNYTYQPKVNLGVLSLWPKPDATAVSTYTLKLTYQRPFYGFTSASETPDFPQEWQLALTYGLADLLAPEYGVPLLDRQVLSKQAKDFLDKALDGGAEETSMFFQAERR